MRSLPRLGLLALAGVLGLAGPASAQVVVRVPFVDVRVGSGVYVRAPFVNLYIPPRRMVLPAPSAPVRTVPVLPTPRRSVLPVPTPIGPGKRAEPPPVPAEELRTVAAPPASTRLATRAMTPGEFASSFKPGGGEHDVVLQHPFTGAPIKVHFTLPDGAPRKVRVNRLRLEFDYGRQRVTIRFFRDGTVSVRS